jgi:hypothetical protein
MPASERPRRDLGRTDGPPARDFRHLPEAPAREQWCTSEDVRTVDPGPRRFAYSDDADLVLRYLAGA